MKDNKRWEREMKRYRILEHSKGKESIFTVERNDKWLLGLIGRWRLKFQTTTPEQAVRKIHKLVSIKTKIGLNN